MLTWIQFIGGIAAATILIGLLYLLKEKFKKLPVSFLPLWRRALKNKPAHTLMQRLKKILSYLLQLAIVTLLLLSITRGIEGNKKETEAIVFIFDTSASMLSTDVKPSRLECSKRFAESIIKTKDPQSTVMLVSATSPVRVIQSWTESSQKLVKKLKSIKASTGTGDMALALRLSSSVLKNLKNKKRQIWILSDGSFSRLQMKEISDAIEDARASNISVFQKMCGEKSYNVAITEFALRQNLKEKLMLSGSIKINSSGDKNKSPGANNLFLHLTTEGNLLLSRPIGENQMGKILHFTTPIPSGNTIVAQLVKQSGETPIDFLPQDNSAKVKISDRLHIKILAIARKNPFLKACLLLSPSWNVELINGNQSPSSNTYDVVISYGFPVPEAIKRKGSFYINPQPQWISLESIGEVTEPRFDFYESNHPLLSWTNLFNINIAKATIVKPAQGDRIIARYSNVPLIIERKEKDGSKTIIFTFDLSESDLVLRTAWPLLFINTIYYLTGMSFEVFKAGNDPEESNIKPTWLKGAQRPPKEKASRRRNKIPLRYLFILFALLLNFSEFITFHRRITC